MRMFALGHQALVALAQPNLRLPTDVLHALGLVCRAQLQLAADLGININTVLAAMRGVAGEPACERDDLDHQRDAGTCDGHDQQDTHGD